MPLPAASHTQAVQRRDRFRLLSAVFRGKFRFSPTCEIDLDPYGKVVAALLQWEMAIFAHVTRTEAQLAVAQTLCEEYRAKAVECAPAHRHAMLLGYVRTVPA